MVSRPHRGRVKRWLNENALILRLIGGLYFAVGGAWVLEDITDRTLASGVLVAVLSLLLLLAAGELDESCEESQDDA